MKSMSIQQVLPSLTIVATMLCGSAIANTKAVDTFPEKPIRLVVTFPAGGGTDVLARIIGSELTKSVGQPVVIDNRPGASGNIGAEFVARSSPDGYTLLVVNSSFAINPGVFKKLTFNPRTDFRGVLQFASVPSVIAVLESSKIRTFKDLLDTGRSGARLSYASCGNGTPQHLAGELLKMTAKVSLQHVAYKGCAPALTDVLGGQTDISINTLANTTPHLGTKKLRALAVTSKTRTSLLPDVPAVSEFGITNYDVDQWFGILAPAQTPDLIIQKLNTEMSKIVLRADIMAKMEKLGFATTNSTPEAFQQLILSDIDRFGKVIQEIGLSID